MKQRGTKLGGVGQNKGKATDKGKATADGKMRQEVIPPCDQNDLKEIHSILR